MNPNETSENQTQAVAIAPKREIRVVEDDSPIGYLMDTGKFEHCYRIAGAMARASLIPKHLKGDSFEQTQANCFLVVNQALRWQVDPFAIAPETYEVGGKLAFQGKLVAAIVNSRGGLSKKLTYTFNDKKGDDLEVTVSGTLEGETEARTITLSVRSARTNNQMWTKDPEQKLVYSGATKWARRHAPGVILGVLTDDDADAIRQEEKDKVYVLSPAPSFQGQTIDVPPTPEPIAAQPAKPVEVSAETKKQRASAPKAHDTRKPVEQEPEKTEVQTSPSEGEAQPSQPAQTSPPPATDIKALRTAITDKGLTVFQVLQWCKANSRFSELGDPAVTLEQLPGKVLAGLLKNITANGPIVGAIKAMPDTEVKAS